MKIPTPAAARDLEHRLRSERNLAESALVARAARGMASHLREVARAAGLARPRAWIVAGKGHNGADACRVAALLREDGWMIDLWLAAEPADLVPVARAEWDRAVAAGARVSVRANEAAWQVDEGEAPLADLFVDGLLGTGLRGAATGVAAAAIRAVNRLSRGALVAALDLPSGLDAATGSAGDPTVRATFTLSAGCPKPAFVTGGAMEWTGPVEQIEIGIPAEWIEQASPASPQPLRVITRGNVAPLFPPRPRASHKGTHGHVLLIGGSTGCTGAIALAARAAVRSGAGLVSVITTQALAPVVAAACPEAMVHGAEEGDDGSVSADLWMDWQKRMDDFDAIVAGPGMGNNQDTMQLLRRVFTGYGRPILLDADAINCFEGRAHWMEKSAGPVVITPHPGEAARLLGSDSATVQSDRVAAVRQLAAATGAVVALKGAGTLVSRATGDTHVNLNGNPGLAAGGTGDVLAGLLGGLLAQRIDPFRAACAAVYLHGLAGDLATWANGERAVTAGDVIARLPDALRAVSAAHHA